MVAYQSRWKLAVCRSPLPGLPGRGLEYGVTIYFPPTSEHYQMSDLLDSLCKFRYRQQQFHTAKDVEPEEYTSEPCFREPPVAVKAVHRLKSNGPGSRAGEHRVACAGGAPLSKRRVSPGSGRTCNERSRFRPGLSKVAPRETLLVLDWREGFLFPGITRRRGTEDDAECCGRSSPRRH